jgi:hypothetical protein
MNPVTPLSATRWQGHLPVASQALASLLVRAARGGMQFSPPERALFTACEFWVAVERRALPVHLGANVADPLRYQSIIFAAMGAHHVACTLIIGVGEFSKSATPLEGLKCLTVLQERLSRTQDPVDELIARLADNLGLSAAPPCADYAEPERSARAG